MCSADPGKHIPSQTPLTPPQIARRLVSARQSERFGGGNAARSAAAACEQLYRDLSRWVGRDGCHALFERALSELRTQNSALDAVRLHPKSDPYVDGVAETIMSHGEAATAQALEKVVTRVVEILGRLVGDDMASILIERSLVSAGSVEPRSDHKREKA